MSGLPIKRVRLQAVSLNPLTWSVTRFIGDVGECLFEGPHLQVAEWLKSRCYEPVLGLNGIWQQPLGAEETPRLYQTEEA